MNECPICKQGFGYFLLPFDDDSKEKIKGFKLFQILKSKFWGVSKPRSVLQLNTYWACCKYIAVQTSDHENILSRNDVDFTVKMRVAKDNPGMIKRFKMIDGIVYVEPISVAFQNMKHLEACHYFDKAFALMGDMVGKSADELIALVKSEMGK